MILWVREDRYMREGVMAQQRYKGQVRMGGRGKNQARTIEISEKKWEEFCRQVDEICHEGLVGVQVEGANGAKKTIVHDLALQSIGLDDKSDLCNTNLIIEAGLPNEKPTMHVVVEPIHIRLKNDRDEKRYNRLEIIAENGTTIVELHPGLNSKELKGLEVMTPKRGERRTTRGVRRGK